MTRRIPARWIIEAHRAFACGLLLCACALHPADARVYGGRGEGMRRQGNVHVAQADVRAARQAERAMQRGGQGRGGPRREQPVPVAPPVAPVYQPPEPPQQARPGRLTPDERRALRQQINEAGRDVYQPR